MKTNKLFKGSRNPPVDIDIFVKTKWGDWGVAQCYYWRKSLTLDFRSRERALYGEPKETFVEWTMPPS